MEKLNQASIYNMMLSKCYNLDRHVTAVYLTVELVGLLMITEIVTLSLEDLLEVNPV